VTDTTAPPSVDLARLTVAKAVANTALRWIPPFLPTLEAAFGASTRQLTTILGLGEMAGLSTIGVGPQLDRGCERLVMSVALVAISISSLVALAGTTFTFAIGFVLIVLGVANCTVAGHSMISHRVAYAQRARAIGLFETSWAFALLIGAPVVAGLITVFGWRGPFVLVGVTSALAAAMLARLPQQPRPAESSTDDSHSALADLGLDDSGARDSGAGDSSDRESVVPARSGRGGLTSTAWAVVIGSAGLAMGGLSVFAISGSWLDDAFGVETGGLGAVAMGYGAIELLASTASAGFADRIGKFRSTAIGIFVMLSGLAIMAFADSTLWVGVVGILTMLGGFEFAFVTSLSMVTEAMPSARGTTIALSNGVGTVARGTGTIASGWLFSVHGVEGSLALSSTAVIVATAAFAFSRLERA
jgi:MFS transporter, DHA1 family, inner membrane transport protein